MNNFDPLQILTISTKWYALHYMFWLDVRIGSF